MIIGTPPQPPVESRASLHNLSGYVTSLSHTFSFCRLLSLLVGPSGRGIGGANLEPSTDGLHEVPGNRPCPNRCIARITLLRPEEVVVVVVVVAAAAAAAAAAVGGGGGGGGVVVEVPSKNAETRRCPGQVREQIDAKVAEWREEGKAGLGLLGLQGI